MSRFRQLESYFTDDSTIIIDWKRILAHFPIESLDYATDEVMCLDPTPYPDGHLGKIKVFATAHQNSKKLQNVTSDRLLREDLAKCPMCRDRGYIEVYHPVGYSPALNGKFIIENHLNTMMVACKCDQGRYQQRPIETGEKNRCRPLKTFDHQTMCPVDFVTTKQQSEQLIEFVQNDYRPHNYNEEFAEFAD